MKIGLLPAASIEHCMVAFRRIMSASVTFLSLCHLLVMILVENY